MLKSADPTEAPRTTRRTERLRQRAAWMYYVEEMTQNAIAEILGVSRASVVRLLAEARSLGEVRIALTGEAADLSQLESAVGRAFGLAETIVAPLSSDSADPLAPIGAALGAHVSGFLRSDMRVGVGWGRTLMRALSFLDARSAQGLSVVSLVGGVAHFERDNSTDFATVFARALGADCYLIPAPAVVDSPATKTTLIERCGIAAVHDFAGKLDAVVVSVGAIDASSTMGRCGILDEGARQTMREYGGVGELLCHVFDREGRLVGHPLNERVMSIPIDALRAAPIRVLAAGGSEKIAAIAGAIRLLRPTTLVTDEASARALLRFAA